RGYDRIPDTPLETRGVFAVRGRERHLARCRDAMLARGLTEAWTTSLISETEAKATAELLGETSPQLLKLTNAVSRESEALRPSPVAGLLRAAAHNLRQGVQTIR